MRGAPEARLLAKIVTDDNGCWIYQGGIDPTGYGRFWLNGRQDYAHRAALTLSGVDVPEGMDVDHLCRVRACCRPSHLEVVTRQVNLLRGETLTRAHRDGVDCGFDACPSCQRHRKMAVAS